MAAVQVYKSPKAKQKLPALQAASAEEVSPASRSMHKTSLYYKTDYPEPQMSSLNNIHEALARDAEQQKKKYGSEQPDSQTARFNVRLPRSPQHEKYSWARGTRRVKTESDDGFGEDDEKVDISQGKRFNTRTLRSWFRDLDRDNTGTVTQRELIVALRKQEGLLEMFAAVSLKDEQRRSLKDEELREKAVTPKDASEKPQAMMHTETTDSAASAASYSSLATDMQLPLGRSVSGKKCVDTQKAEIYRMRSILREIDSDGNGVMEWPEFVDFFRRAGLLLEYKIDTGRNRTSVDQVALVLGEFKAKQKESKEGDPMAKINEDG